MAYQNDNEKRQFFEDRSIQDTRDQEQVLKGITPKNQLAYKIFKAFRTIALSFLFLSILGFILTFIDTFSQFTTMHVFRLGVVLLGGISLVCFLCMLFIRFIFLRKCPFDDWVYEVAQRDLGTSVIFYTSKCIYINYDIATAKEVDKRDFVTKMSDLSIHYSYFYVNTFVDQQVIQVECTKKQPIPNMASFNANDDIFWNIVPLGLTINNLTQKVSPIGWWLNDNNKNDQLVPTIPSTSVLICGGTGCHGKDELILMANGSVKNIQDIQQGEYVMGPDGSPRLVMDIHRGEDEMFEIETEDGKKHILNKDHMLHLMNKDDSKDRVDISVAGYICMDDEFKDKYKLVKVSI